MTPERWRQIKDLFDAVAEKTPDERSGYLTSSCGDDAELRREVESLIAAYGDAGSKYEKPVIHSDPMIGRQIGAYRILRRLGTGGMGSIYLAARADDQFRRLVAVKAIRAELLDEHTRRRFENERHTLAALEHPNIVKLLDGGTTEDGIPYLVMDYVEGQPIDRFCRDRSLTVRERLALFRTLCGAVHFAHQNLVVHRDLKPANILVTPQGVPKLLDFGIAKLLRPAYAAATVGFTRTVAQPMTPEYASPEQLLGQPITTASDIYSLGVLLYILLAGEHPYERLTKSTLELEQAVCEGRTKKPSEIAPTEIARQLRGDLDTIVLCAMRKEPQRRYASAEHLSEDVRRHLEGQPVTARGDTLLYRAGKFAARHRPGVAASTAAVLALAFLGWSEHQDRLRAESEFQNVRDIANWVIHDLDKAMQKGTTQARETAVGRALQYLDRLRREARSDIALQREALDGYSEIASIQGDIFKANTGKRGAAEESLNKALPLAEALSRRDGQKPETRKLLLRFHEALATIRESEGDHTGAIEHYQKALEFADADRYEALMVLSKLPQIQTDVGDAAGALDTCRKWELAGSQWENPTPQDGRKERGLAFARERTAWFSLLAGEPAANAEEPIRKAINSYYEPRVEQHPSSKNARLSLANAYETLAEVLKRENRIPEALDYCHRSRAIHEGLRTADTTNAQFAVALADNSVLLTELLVASGDSAGARAQTAQALANLRPPVHEEEPELLVLLRYIRILIETPFPDLAKTDDAVPLARRAVEISKGKDPESLELLARAYEKVGNPPEALRATDKALALLAPVAPGKPVPELRAQLEALRAQLGNGQREGK
jgi:serine/threonine protein kinase/tetratricopeptide (TPR) repeat protein